MKFRATMNPMKHRILPTSVHHREAYVCVLGCGYVGESILSHFSKVTNTIGFDISEARVAELKEKYRDNSHVRLTTSASELSKGTHFLIAVPTLLCEGNSIDLEAVKTAIQTIITHARPGGVIMIESSVPIGTTRKLLGPYKSTFNCGMSPERIDPGRVEPSAEQIPKVISALTSRAMKHIFALYAMVYQTLVPVSKPEVAEMTKLYENCYRMVNIAYVNEISDACVSHGIDPHEMIKAAATKPFGFQPFYPGLGVGGHCIPINPWYLFTNNKGLRVLETATKLMKARPEKQAKRFYRALQSRILDKSHSEIYARKPRILLVGLGFKNGQVNLAGSPAVAFGAALKDLGCSRLAFYDPAISQDKIPWLERLDRSLWHAEYMNRAFDAVAVCNKRDMDTALLTRLDPKILVKSFT